MSSIKDRFERIHHGLMSFLKARIKNDKIYSFIENMGIVFLFNGTAVLFQLIAGILAARLLGPEEYGKVSLVNNIGLFLVAPMTLGAFNAMFKYLPKSGARKQRDLTNMTGAFNALTILPICLVYLLIYPLVGGALKIPFDIWVVAIIFTASTDIYMLSESFVRGRKDFLFIGKTQVVSKGIFLSLLLVLLAVLRIRSYTVFLIASITASVFFSVLAFIRVKPSFKNIKWAHFKNIYKYGSITMVNTLLLNCVIYMDVIILNYFQTSMDLGIYAVYKNFALTMFMVFFDQIFSVVFMPTIAGMDIKMVFKKIFKWLPLIFLGLVAAISLLVSTLLLLFGKDYGFNILYVLLTALGIACYGIFELLLVTITLEGKQGAKICTYNLAVGAPLSIGIQFLFIQNWGITGGFLAIITSNLILAAGLSISFFMFIKRNLIRSSQKVKVGV